MPSSDFLFLTILGVPLAGPLAVLVFLGGFIPYIGGFMTTTIMLPRDVRDGRARRRPSSCSS